MALGTLGGLILATTLCAQEGGPGVAWRGAGPQPCFGPEGGSYQCPQLPGSIAIRAGRLLDSKTGQMLPDQVVLILNDRIAQVGPAAQITRTRSGSRCRSPAMPNGRYRMHGGMSPGAPKGNKNALKHGHYTAEAIARRREIANMLREARALVKEVN